MKTFRLPLFARVMLAYMLLALFAAVAYADPTATPPGVDPTIMQLGLLVIGLVAAVLMPIAAALGLAAAKWVKTKTGLDLTADIDRVAQQAVGLAEQLAVKRLRESNLAMPGGEKLQIALKHFLDIAEKKGWPEWVRNKATDYVEAKLGDRPKLLELSTTTELTTTVEGA